MARIVCHDSIHQLKSRDRERLNLLERTQYQAALAVSGSWKGTNMNKIYDELGWESLNHRRMFSYECRGEQSHLVSWEKMA